MTINEMYEIGFKRAYGVDQMVDLEGAYEMWCNIEYMLTPADKEIFSYIKDCLSESDRTSSCAAGSDEFREFGGSLGDYLLNIAHTTKSETKTESQVQAKFFESLALAQRNGKLDALYKVIEKFCDGENEYHIQQKKEKNPKHVRVGNNLNYYIFRFWRSVDQYHKSTNMLRRQKGLGEKKSVQGVYQVISGINGMDDAGKMILVELVNRFNRIDPRLKREIVVKDLDLPLYETVELFINRKLDERTEKLLKEEQHET